MVTVTARLFDAGLADPRGGAYREVELSDPDDGNSAPQTHGWVFSGEYAVCWNGLVYPVRSVGAPADLDRDVNAISGAQPWSRSLPFRREPSPAETAFWLNMELGQTMAPASVALLLRLGRPDLAVQLWQAPDPAGHVRETEPSEAEWLSTAARAWLGTAFWRLTRARTRNDDQAAAGVAESLLGWESRVQALWKQMPESAETHLVDLSFLEPVPILLADSRRRLRGPARPFVDFRALIESARKGTPSAFSEKPQAARIGDLIGRLEDVRAEKMTWPGSLMFSFDPICELLTREGEAAVDSLLDVYERDQRLTRTLDYTRPWSTARTPIPVSQVAKIILGDILHAPKLVEDSTPAELRAWWEKHKASGSVDRSFDSLADDHAAAERWLESASHITLRSDVQLSDGMTFTQTENCSPKKPAPAPYGEELRRRQGPSVSELLAKRAAALAASQQVDAACRMAFMAFLWEPKISLPVLRMAGNLEGCRGDSLVAAARMSLGDLQAAAGWTAEIKNRVSQPGFRVSELSPLWMFPDDPVLDMTAKELFVGPDAPLSPAVGRQEIHSPLLTAPAYRQAVVSALSDNSVVEKATRSPEAPPGQERPIRVKDMTARQLSQLDGAPEFQLDWPESDRDTAIANIAQFLRMHEMELRAFPAKPQDTSCPGEYVYLGQ